MADITYEILKNVAVLSDRGKGWSKEVNLVRWNNGPVKVDIREWNSDHTSMKKGITFSEDEFAVLKKALINISDDFSKKNIREDDFANIAV